MTFIQGLITAVIGAVVLGLFLISPIIAYNTDEYVNFTVKEKERVCSTTSEGSDCKYLVFTNIEVYENTDSLWYWKWNSSDVYGALDKGASYKARVYGFRVPFLSWYRNIVSIEKTNN